MIEVTNRVALGGDRARTFVFASVVISILCLGYIARQSLETVDFFSVGIFRHLLVSQDYAAAMLGVGILAVVFFVKSTDVVLTIVRVLGKNPAKVAAAAFVAFSIGALFAYHDHPLSMDEYSSRFQSEIFAAGELTGKFPVPLLNWLIPPPFQNYFLPVSYETGQVVSGYMPGFALLLTPFTYLGIPWACNPMIGALSLLALHRIASEITQTEEAGGWAILFALASPVFSVNAMSYYSMPAHLLLNAIYTLLLLRPTPRRALIAGLVGGWALVLHNPLPHVLYAVPWFAWLVWKRDVRCLGALALGYVPLALLLGMGWLMLTGDLQSAAKASESATAAAAGNAWDVWMAQVHKVVRLPNADILQARVAGAVKLWVWAVPGLPLLAWFGFLIGRHKIHYRLLLASGITTFVGYFLIPFDQGHGWGYRYFHSAWGILPLLAAGAVTIGNAEEFNRRQIVAIAGWLALASLVFSTGLRVWQVEGFIDRHLSQVPIARVDKRQVVFVNVRWGYYSIDLVQNHPLLQRKTIYMVSYGSKRNAEMARHLAPTARQVTAGKWGELWSLE